MKFLMLLWALLGYTCSFAQNLVPNPSFENYNNCPTDIAQIGGIDYLSFFSVKDWAKATRGAAQYFNECNNSQTNHIIGVPSNAVGFQYARTGKAYCDIELISGYINADRKTLNTVFVCKYIQTKLLQPLVKGKQYLVAYYVVNANSEERNILPCCKDVADLSSNTVCANLSIKRPFDSTLTKEFHLRADIKPDSIITTDSFWTRVCGIYTAQGGEEWLTIGDFLDLKDVRIAPLNPQSDTAQPDGSRVYIDDVSVEEVNSLVFPNASKDTIICTKSVNMLLHAESGAGRYIWNTGDTTDAIHISDTGTYWFRCDLGCGEMTDTIHVGYQAFRSLASIPDTSICFGDTLQLYTNQPFSTYLWSTGDTTKTTTITKTGKYILRVEDACGIQQDTFIVAAKPPSPAPIVSDTVICQGLADPKLNVQGIGHQMVRMCAMPSLNATANYQYHEYREAETVCQSNY